MYHFVKIKRKGSDNDGIWYFKPISEEQVVEHFKTVFGGEIKEGVRDRFKGTHFVEDNNKPDGFWVYHEHPTTPWARAIEPLMHLYGCSWVEAATRLENEVLNNRINDFRKGIDMYLDNGVIQTWMVDGDEIAEEIEKDSLEYPLETQCRFEDVRYMQWNMPDMPTKGLHWYAKIGKRDIVDKDGNMKWNTKKEAEEAARWFIDNKIMRKRYNY